MSSLSTEILFEKFQIIEVLKKDDHAAVFLANHIYLNKKIILKVLNTVKIHDSSMIERFKREGKILAKLDHSNIIKVLDFGMSKEFFYISFEYIEGESLRNIFKTKSLTPEQKEHVMIQLLQGLDYAHSNQIIHRDIKPENIFIDKNLNVKLGDFGLALSAEDNYVTNPYSIVGTPSYMSPEQVRGSKLTAQSDLFSLGVVLCELFTGKNPFLKENVSLTLNELNSFDEAALENNIVDVPQNIKDVLIKLLKKNLNQRFESAAEVLEDLEVEVDQPNIIVNRVDGEARKTKLAWAFIIAVTVIVVGIIALPKVFEPGQNQFGADSNAVQKNEELNNKNNTSPFNSNQTKDPVEINNFQKPLIDSPKQKENVIQQNENPLTPIGNGGLFVECNPWADVYVGGEKYGTTPLDSAISLPAGSYSLRLSNPAYPSIPPQMINIKANQVNRLKINLNNLIGSIKCFINPWGDVYINNEFKKQVTTSELFRVLPGRIRLVIKNPNFQDIDTLVTIKEGDTLLIKRNFTKK